jgi:hypothetical protein
MFLPVNEWIGLNCGISFDGSACDIQDGEDGEFYS